MNAVLIPTVDSPDAGRGCRRAVPLPFGGVPDTIVADRVQADMIRYVGRTRGLFSGVDEWPLLADVLEEKSRATMAAVGKDCWESAGGIHGLDGRLTCELVSDLTAEAINEVVREHDGLVWQDELGTVRAVRFIPHTAASGDALLGLSLASPVPGAVGQVVPASGKRNRTRLAAGRASISRRAAGLRLVCRAEQIHWAIFGAVHLQRRSTVLLPDILLRDLIWGAGEWPADWRREVTATLVSLMDLRAEVMRISAEGWRPRFGSRSVLVEHVEDLRVTDADRDRRCDPSCPLWDQGRPHKHFKVGIGLGFLGVLERFCSDEDQYSRTYNFYGRPAKDDGESGDTDRHPVDQVVVNFPSAVYGPAAWGGLSDDDLGVLRGLGNELTRRRPGKAADARPDRAQVQVGNRVTDVSAKRLVECPHLDRDGRYVIFGGNGNRAGAGYKIVGDHGRGWLFKCGTVLSSEATPTEVCRAVRGWLLSLRRVTDRFGLTVVGVARRGDRHEWYTLPELQTLGSQKAGVEQLLGLHVRVYGTPDYHTRIRHYFAECGGFAHYADTSDESYPVHPQEPNGLGSRLLLAGVSQKAVAERLGVTPAFVSQVVSGSRRLPEGHRAAVEQMLAERECLTWSGTRPTS